MKLIGQLAIHCPVAHSHHIASATICVLWCIVFFGVHFTCVSSTTCMHIPNDTSNTDCKCRAFACTESHGTTVPCDPVEVLLIKSGACTNFDTTHCNFSPFKLMGWKLHRTESRKRIPVQFPCEPALNDE